MRRLFFMFAVAASVLTTGCAENECNFNSQCRGGMYCFGGSCRQDCRADTDCPSELVCSPIGMCVPEGSFDAAVDSATPDSATPTDSATPMDSTVPPMDSTVPPRDSTMPPMDSTMPPVDSAVPPVDSMPVGTGRYLDRCAVGGDCASGLCTDDIGGTRFCTQSCTAHSSCADEHLCAGGICVPDDTGRPCSVPTPESCSMGLCLGPSGGSGACTRDCGSAIDCPSGYACTDQPGVAFRICVDIEKACTGPESCGTGICLSAQGCTARCRTASDCPARATALGVPSYSCAEAFGSGTPICVPPADILGPDPAGSLCSITSNTCRSGLCDTSAPLGPMCTQICDAEGGCGPGLGCFPVVDGGTIHLLCSRAGTGALGAPCTTGRECESGLCDATSSRCTRLCADALCPTGWTCEPVAGFGLNICRP